MKKYGIKTEIKEMLEPEEILLDTGERKKREKGKLELPIQNKVFVIIFAIFFLFFVSIISRTVYLVFAKGEEFKESAINNYLKTEFVEAPRGLIISKDSKTLAENKETGEDLSEEKARIYSRNYIDSEYFSFILGYTREAAKEEIDADKDYYRLGDWIGKDGVEKQYEKYIRGDKGKREIIVNSKGKILSDEVVKEPKIGNTLVLNIDAELQKKIQDTIKQEVPGRDAAAIAINPQNGAVLAMVSVPSDDNNVWSQKQISQEELQKLQKEKKIYNINRVIKGKYPVGSIIKPLVGVAALQEKVITAGRNIVCKGSVIIPNPWAPQSPTEKKDNKTHGVTNLEKAIAESCNVYFFIVGGGYENIKGLGITGLKKYFDLFHLEELLGIDLPGERTGFVPTKEWFDKEMKSKVKRNWSIADIYDVSIGQGFFSGTPLNMAYALSAIANGGKIFQPQVADKIIDSEGNVIENIEPKVLREGFISKENIAQVKSAMRACVTSGSCVRLNQLPVSSGGKTGTAESGRRNYPHAWFVSFAPYENPEILLLVLVEYGGEGARVASPIAKDVLEWYFTKDQPEASDSEE